MGGAAQPRIEASTESALVGRAALSEAVSAPYERVLGALRSTPVETLHATASPFGQEMPKWRILTFGLEHGMRTRGQLVPYFRIHGIDPPDRRLF